MADPKVGLYVRRRDSGLGPQAAVRPQARSLFYFSKGMVEAAGGAGLDIRYA